jgi:translation initiation factor 1
MSGLFAGSQWERPVTCERCEKPLDACACPRDAAGELKPPASQAVRVQREKRRGKYVTVVTGLDATASDLPALARAFQKSFGVGGTVKNDTIELQGDQRDAVVAELKALGYPAKAAGG